MVGKDKPLGDCVKPVRLILAESVIHIRMYHLGRRGREEASNSSKSAVDSASAGPDDKHLCQNHSYLPRYLHERAEVS